MIASSRWVMALALAVSAAGLLAVSAAFLAPISVSQTEGGGDLVPAQLGGSFAELSAGVARPAAKVAAQAAKPPVPQRAAQAVAAPRAPVQTATTAPPMPAQTGAPPLVRAENPAPAPAVSPSAAVSAAAVPAAAPRPPQAPRSNGPPVTRHKAGNAKQSVRKGSASGTVTGTGKPASKRQTPKPKTGNAAATNYPGVVMAHLAGARKPRLRTKGAAVVRFTLAADGRLAGVAIAKTSGSGRFDQAALRMVQSAAPFPRPPQGATRSFSVRIKGQ